MSANSSGLGGAVGDHLELLGGNTESLGHFLGGLTLVAAARALASTMGYQGAEEGHRGWRGAYMENLICCMVAVGPAEPDPALVNPMGSAGDLEDPLAARAGDMASPVYLQAAAHPAEEGLAS